MKEVSVADFEKNFDTYMDRIENGEEFLIRQPDGRAVVAVPASQLDQDLEHVGEDEWYYTYNNHDDSS